MEALQRQVDPGLSARLQRMEEAIGALDFDRALHLCDALIEGL